MIEPKFTSGPLKFTEKWTIHKIPMQPAIRKDNGDIVATFSQVKSEDGSLYAAAPDLYESLSNILIWASTIASLYPGHERNEGTVEGDISAARAALAKAVGK